MGLVFPALFSALLLILAQPPSPFFFLSPVALIPFIVALGRLPGGPVGGRDAGKLGLVFGVGYWGTLLIWVPLVVAPRFPYAYPGYLAQVGLLGGLASLMAWVVWLLHRGRTLPLALAFPLAWVVMEWLKAHFPFGLAFPWMGLGISLTSWPDALGFAEWTGEAGVSFWLAAVNGLLASGFLAFGEVDGGSVARRRGLVLGGTAILLAVLPAAAGVLRTRSLTMVPGPRVAVVGTAVPRALRLRPRESTVVGLEQAETALRGLEGDDVDLAVLPEALVSVPLNGTQGAPFREALVRLARALGAPILVGGLGLRSEAPGGGAPEARLTNSAFLFGSEGRIQGRYDKVRLVPGMEWSAYARGRRGVVLPVGGIVVGPLICYESIFGDLARTERNAGANLLVNLSSDVWFGSYATGPASIFLHQHAAHLVMRAVENRVGVARAANGGISTLLSPSGKAIAPVVPPTGGLAVGTVPVLERTTLFARTGDLVGPAALLACCLVLLRSCLRSRHSRGPSRASGDPGRQRG